MSNDSIDWSLFYDSRRTLNRIIIYLEVLIDNPTSQTALMDLFCVIGVRETNDYTKKIREWTKCTSDQLITDRLAIIYCAKQLHSDYVLIRSAKRSFLVMIFSLLIITLSVYLGSTFSKL